MATPYHSQSWAAALTFRGAMLNPNRRETAKTACLYTSMSHSKPVFVDQHYTVAEVAALLRVHQMTVRHWYSKQGLRIQRVGKQGVRIAARDLRSFLEKCTRRSSRVAHSMDQCGSTAEAGGQKEAMSKKREEM
jgi:excisionase family DNA binding protein